MANAGVANQEAPERSILEVALVCAITGVCAFLLSETYGRDMDETRETLPDAAPGSGSRQRNCTTKATTEMPPVTVRAGGISRERGARPCTKPSSTRSPTASPTSP